MRENEKAGDILEATDTYFIPYVPTEKGETESITMRFKCDVEMFEKIRFKFSYHRARHTHKRRSTGVLGVWAKSFLPFAITAPSEFTPPQAAATGSRAVARHYSIH